MGDSVFCNVKNVALQHDLKRLFSVPLTPCACAAHFLALGLRDEKDFFDAFVHFPMAGKTFGQNKAVTCTKKVGGAVQVNDSAAAFQDVAKLHIARAVRAEHAGRGFPHTAAELAVLRTEALQRLVGGVAANGAVGLAVLGVREVLGLNADELGCSSHGRW